MLTRSSVPRPTWDAGVAYVVGAGRRRRRLMGSAMALSDGFAIYGSSTNARLGLGGLRVLGGREWGWV